MAAAQPAGGIVIINTIFNGMYHTAGQWLMSAAGQPAGGGWRCWRNAMQYIGQRRRMAISSVSSESGSWRGGT